MNGGLQDQITSFKANKLKRVQTNDRSSPVVAGGSSGGGGGGPPSGGRGIPMPMPPMPSRGLPMPPAPRGAAPPPPTSPGHTPHSGPPRATPPPPTNSPPRSTPMQAPPPPPRSMSPPPGGAPPPRPAQPPPPNAPPPRPGNLPPKPGAPPASALPPKPNMPPPGQLPPRPGAPPPKPSSSGVPPPPSGPPPTINTDGSDLESRFSFGSQLPAPPAFKNVNKVYPSSLTNKRRKTVLPSRSALGGGSGPPSSSGARPLPPMAATAPANSALSPSSMSSYSLSSSLPSNRAPPPPPSSPPGTRQTRAPSKPLPHIPNSLKSPTSSLGAISSGSRSSAEIKSQLRDAVEQQDFEAAARLRDELKIEEAREAQSAGGDTLNEDQYNRALDSANSRMKTAADDMDFENAAKMRDIIKQLKELKVAHDSTGDSAQRQQLTLQLTQLMNSV